MRHRSMKQSTNSAIIMTLLIWHKTEGGEQKTPATKCRAVDVCAHAYVTVAVTHKIGP